MWNKICIDVFGDDRGQLLPIEFQNLEFKPKRLYTIFGNQNGLTRGEHAHKNLKQLIVNISGEFDLYLYDGKNSEVVELRHPGQAVYVSGVVWRELRNISEDCVINVLADQPFKQADYIHSLDEFYKEVIKDDNV